MTLDPQIIARMQALVKEAYDAGYAAGRAEAVEAIMRAAQSPLPKQPGKQARKPLPLDDGGDRAPRGALRAAIRQALEITPGMTGQELETVVPQLDSRLSWRSVGGELRRMKGKEYRQDGKRWFLVGQESERREDTSRLSAHF